MSLKTGDNHSRDSQQCKGSIYKNGNPFGRMTLEDYRNSWELTLFGKDYINYKNYFVKDCPLLIKGKIQPKFYNEDELELKVKSMSLLADAKRRSHKKHFT
jgi:DNA polymerase III subunit alpha